MCGSLNPRRQKLLHAVETLVAVRMFSRSEFNRFSRFSEAISRGGLARFFLIADTWPYPVLSPTHQSLREAHCAFGDGQLCDKA